MTADVHLAVGERDCARARWAHSLVLDQEAGAADLEALAVHLERCGSCRRFAAEVSAFTRALRTAAPRTQDHLWTTRDSKGERS